MQYMREYLSTGNYVNRNFGQIFGLERATNNWLILSNIAFDCRFLIAVHVGLTSKSLSNGIKFHLNSEPLLKLTLRGLGYLDSHTSLNI